MWCVSGPITECVVISTPPAPEPSSSSSHCPTPFFSLHLPEALFSPCTISQHPTHEESLQTHAHVHMHMPLFVTPNSHITCESCTVMKTLKKYILATIHPPHIPPPPSLSPFSEAGGVIADRGLIINPIK